MPASSVSRFWDKVDKTETCWLWTASLISNGYGQFGRGPGTTVAHRIAYEQTVGPIPEGLQLDHLCRVRHCVNPAHLEPVTCRENVRRGRSGEGAAARMLSKTHCPQNHPYSGDNLTIRKSGARECRTCANARRRERRRSNASI